LLSPPQMRPALYMVASVVLVIAVVVIFGTGPTPDPVPRSSNGRPVTRANEPATSGEGNGASKTAAASPQEKANEEMKTTSAPTVDTKPYVPESARELADYLAKHDTARVVLDRDLDLTRDDVLTFHGSDLLIEGAVNGRQRPTLRLEYSGW